MGTTEDFETLMFVRNDFLVTVEPSGYCLVHALSVLAPAQTLCGDKKGQPTTVPLVTLGNERSKQDAVAL